MQSTQLKYLAIWRGLYCVNGREHWRKVLRCKMLQQYTRYLITITLFFFVRCYQIKLFSNMCNGTILSSWTLLILEKCIVVFNLMPQQPYSANYYCAEITINLCLYFPRFVCWLFFLFIIWYFLTISWLVGSGFQNKIWENTIYKQPHSILKT